MNTNEKLFKAFNIYVKKTKEENIYIPIVKTIEPKRVSFNDTWINIREELIKLKGWKL
tara:strand:- start:1195 stop:1368 length:174 start_codon:yes stop_codon:yes gene_type:complete